MSGIFLSGGATVPDAMTVTTTWGNVSGARTGTVTAVAQTINVPSSNPGTLNLSYSVSAGTPGTVEYSKNGGAFAAVALSPSTTPVTFANGDTLNFHVTAASGTYGVALAFVDSVLNSTPKRTDSPALPATCNISGT